MKIAECVPNISTARDPDILDKLIQSVSTPGVSLLHVDAGKAVDRTVMTLAGEPDALKEAALGLIELASKLIDLRDYTGIHPHIGVVDVCPFVPLVDMTMDECIEMANWVGREASRRFGLPVFLYAQAATELQRAPLVFFRRGGHSVLAERLQAQTLTPDFGEPELHPSAGALIIGAREILVAYNITLDTSDEKVARSIAAKIRSSSSSGLPNLQAIGWYVDQYKTTQISFNLLDYRSTPPHVVFERVVAEAKAHQVCPRGSELIGLIPEAALLVAGTYYTNRESRPETSKTELLNLAVERLGLSLHGSFSLEERILERRLTACGLTL